MTHRPALISSILAGATALVLVAALALEPSPVRATIVAAFLLAGPGLALVPPLHVPDRVLAGVLVVATSLTLATIVAGIQLVGGLWSPTATLVVLCLVTLGGAALQARPAHGAAPSAAARRPRPAAAAQGVDDAPLAVRPVAGRLELEAAAAEASPLVLARSGERIETASAPAAGAQADARSALDAALAALRSEAIAAERLAATEMRALDEVLGAGARAATGGWPTFTRAGREDVLASPSPEAQLVRNARVA